MENLFKDHVKYSAKSFGQYLSKFANDGVLPFTAYTVTVSPDQKTATISPVAVMVDGVVCVEDSTQTVTVQETPEGLYRCTIIAICRDTDVESFECQAFAGGSYTTQATAITEARKIYAKSDEHKVEICQIITGDTVTITYPLEKSTRTYDTYKEQGIAGFIDNLKSYTDQKTTEAEEEIDTVIKSSFPQLKVQPLEAKATLLETTSTVTTWTATVQGMTTKTNTHAFVFVNGLLHDIQQATVSGEILSVSLPASYTADVDVMVRVYTTE